MSQVLTLPLEVAVDILTNVLNNPNAGWQGQDEKNQWTMGHATDPDSGMEFFQVIVDPLIVTAVS